MASGNMATAHFDGRHIHYANRLTVYIDDVKKCSYDGGSTCSVKVTPGNHIIKILVYNDASEEAYWLGPFPAFFEAGEEYDLAPGKSGYAENRKHETEFHDTYGSTGSGTETGGGCGCLVLIIIAAVVLISGISSSIRGFLPSPSKDTNQTQVTGPAETPSDEMPDDLDDEQSGFIFPNSDTELIEQQEIEGLSDSDLTYAINEIYARHGYIFRSDELRGYYEQFSWYTGEIPANEFSVDIFNQIEQQNWNLLVNERNSRKASG